MTVIMINVIANQDTWENYAILAKQPLINFAWSTTMNSVMARLICTQEKEFNVIVSSFGEISILFSSIIQVNFR